MITLLQKKDQSPSIPVHTIESWSQHVLLNTKPYHWPWLLCMSTQFVFYKINYIFGFNFQTVPNLNIQKLLLGQNWNLSKYCSKSLVYLSRQNHNWSLFAQIINEKLTKSVIGSSWSWLKNCPESLVSRKSYQITRRLCVLSNTKLYHQNLLLWISIKFAFWMAKSIFLHSSDQYKT